MESFFKMPPHPIKPRASFRKAMIVLSILTVAVGAVAVYLYAMPIGWFYVTLESPESLWGSIPIITNPNPFLLEAIENPGKRINVYGGQLESHRQLNSLLERLRGGFEYEGRYYRFHWEWAHPEMYRVVGSFDFLVVYERGGIFYRWGPFVAFVQLGSLVLGVCWTAFFGVYAYRRKKMVRTRE